MAGVRTTLAALLAFAALAVLAGPAAGSAPRADTTKFCSAVSAISDVSDGSQPTQQQAKQAVQGFKKAAKYAPAKVKSAMNNIAKFLGVLAGTTDPSDLAKAYQGSNFKNYGKSISTYANYVATNCS
jgi:hypothetical protein